MKVIHETERYAVIEFLTLRTIIVADGVELSQDEEAAIRQRWDITPNVAVGYDVRPQPNR